MLEGDCESIWSQFLYEKGFVGKEFVTRIKDYYQDYEWGQLNIIEYEEFLLYPLTLLSVDILSQLRKDYLDRIRLLTRPSIMEYVDWHRDQGHTLLVITASNSFIAEPIAHLLNISHLICTLVERAGILILLAGGIPLPSRTGGG